MEQKIRKMIEEMLARRYIGILKENNMCFRDYEKRCFDEAEKVITQETKRDDKKITSADRDWETHIVFF